MHLNMLLNFLPWHYTWQNKTLWFLGHQVSFAWKPSLIYMIPRDLSRVDLTFIQVATLRAWRGLSYGSRCYIEVMKCSTSGIVFLAFWLVHSISVNSSYKVWPNMGTDRVKNLKTSLSRVTCFAFKFFIQKSLQTDRMSWDFPPSCLCQSNFQSFCKMKTE